MEPKETSVAAAMPLQTAPTPNPSDGLGPVTPNAPAISSPMQTPSQADDSDVIEPAWVAAVQHIMNRYRHDPYALSQAMTALREDYLMKRYNKRVGSEE